jgi:hypothetical protein
MTKDHYPFYSLILRLTLTEWGHYTKLEVRRKFLKPSTTKILERGVKASSYPLFFKYFTHNKSSSFSIFHSNFALSAFYLNCALSLFPTYDPLSATLFPENKSG